MFIIVDREGAPVEAMKKCSHQTAGGCRARVASALCFQFADPGKITDEKVDEVLLKNGWALTEQNQD